MRVCSGIFLLGDMSSLPLWSFLKVLSGRGLSLLLVHLAPKASISPLEAFPKGKASGHLQLGVPHAPRTQCRWNEVYLSPVCLPSANPVLNSRLSINHFPFPRSWDGLPNSCLLPYLIDSVLSTSSTNLNLFHCFHFCHLGLFLKIKIVHNQGVQRDVLIHIVNWLAQSS